MLFSDGTVKCFGGNTDDQLGIESTDDIGDDTGEMVKLLTSLLLFRIYVVCDLRSASDIGHCNDTIDQTVWN